MKKAFKLFVTIFALAFISNVSFGQNPTYTLDVNELTDTGSNIVNFYEFDIDMTWTNSGIAPNYEYAGGQFFFDFNKVHQNGATLQMTNAGSDLPVPCNQEIQLFILTSTPGQIEMGS
ncbi:MAG: hypothetical protein IPG99_12385 [Ignavibacteria bacterium]|nr:hypothetical protein [Ignavibacteria bacterium]